MVTHSSILAWRIPGTEEPGRLQSTGSQESDTAEAPEHTRSGVAQLAQLVNLTVLCLLAKQRALWAPEYSSLYVLPQNSPPGVKGRIGWTQTILGETGQLLQATWAQKPPSAWPEPPGRWDSLLPGPPGRLPCPLLYPQGHLPKPRPRLAPLSACLWEEPDPVLRERGEHSGPSSSWEQAVATTQAHRGTRRGGGRAAWRCLAT